MLARTAQYIARELQYDADREEVLHFGLQLVANFVSGMIALAAVGYILGTLWTTLFAALVAGSLKIFAGGAHSSSSRNCVIIGTLYFGLTGWAAARGGPVLPLSVAGLLFAVTAGATLWAIWRYAPAEPPEKPLATRAQRDKMRAASFVSLSLLCAIILFLGFEGWRTPLAGEAMRAMFAAGIAGLAWQSFVLTPAGYRMAALWDEILSLPRVQEVKGK